jgi:hypothetical protein
MFGTIARYVSLKLAASLIVAAALPVGLVAAAAVTSHPATPGHATFTTPNHAAGTTNQSGVAEPTETPDATAAGDATNQDGTNQDGTNQDGTGPRPTDNHGYAVSQVAQNPQATGGPNGNHGGAVSTVARGDHGPCGTNPPGKSGAHCPFPTPTPTP